MKRFLQYGVIGLVLSLCALGTFAGSEPLKAHASVPDPQFNRLYPNDQIMSFLRGYESAFPEWVKLESLGKTSGGGDTWLVTLNNPSTGPEDGKPAMYIDGATHANEVQGTETVLYVLNYMLHNYGKLDSVTELMDRAVFYFVPIISYDSRNAWFLEPATPNFPRTVQVSIDDDRDGALDEDFYDDLDGDGIITQMRKKVEPGEGGSRLDPKDPRLLVAVEEDELGDYIQLGSEGFDNDGDGRINEDTIGYLDPNRTWGYGWQPRYVQNGTSQYPLQIPETGNVARWALQHMNIAASQSFHNTGRMILRGPGSKLQRKYDRRDIQVYDRIGEEGEKLLPGYNYWILWKDLYTAFGGTVDHFYGVQGAISFTNELFGPVADFDDDGEVSDAERMKFNDRLTLGRQFVEWKEVEHPQYGTVEVGGYRNDTGRVPEGWMLEEDCHRNAAFVLFHASHLPRLSFGEPKVENLDKNLWRVELPVQNDRAIPSVTSIVRQLKLHRVDLATVEGAKVIASGVVTDRWLNKVDLQDHRPERLLVDGIDGNSVKRLFFLVEGKGSIQVRYDSIKAGRIETTIALK